MSDWTEVKISVNADDVDKAGDIASMVLPYGIYIEDYRELEKEAWEIAHIDLIDEDLLAKDRSKAIVHVYISPEENPMEAVAFLRERYTAENIDNEIILNQCKNEDWENNWKQYFHPIPVGEKLLIRPIWEEEFEAGKNDPDDDKHRKNSTHSKKNNATAVCKCIERSKLFAKIGYFKQMVHKHLRLKGKYLVICTVVTLSTEHEKCRADSRSELVCSDYVIDLATGGSNRCSRNGFLPFFYNDSSRIFKRNVVIPSKCNAAFS